MLGSIPPAPTKYLFMVGFKEVEETLLLEELLALDSTFTFENEPFEEFVENLIMNYNRDYNTVIAGTTDIQTTSDKHRSIGDIYRICKFYYPNIILKELKTILNKLYYKSILGSLFCHNIKKRTYHPRGDRDYGYETGSWDEYGWPFDVERIID